MGAFPNFFIETAEILQLRLNYFMTWNRIAPGCVVKLVALPIS